MATKKTKKTKTNVKAETWVVRIPAQALELRTDEMTRLLRQVPSIEWARETILEDMRNLVSANSSGFPLTEMETGRLLSHALRTAVILNGMENGVS